MSLTRLLRETPDIAQRLSALIPFDAQCYVVGSRFDAQEMRLPEVRQLLARNEDSSREIPMLSQPRTRNYALVGTAFDYMIRAHLHQLARRPTRFSEGSIAERAISLMGQDSAVDDDTARRYDSIWDSASQEVDRYRVTHSPERLAAACIGLAKIDGYFRNAVTDPTVARYEEPDWLDMLDLFRVVPWDQLFLGDRPNGLRLNPEFGSISELFNGADADLVSDGTLIDFKTTIHLDLVKHFPQLVGYSMIIEEYRNEQQRAVTGPDFPEIDRAGIYFARHGLLVTFDLAGARENPDYPEAKEVLWRLARERHVEGAAFA
jgi:hypothetical protein